MMEVEELTEQKVEQEVGKRWVMWMKERGWLRGGLFGGEMVHY
jgi:hypothetical protein